MDPWMGYCVKSTKDRLGVRCTMGTNDIPCLGANVFIPSKLSVALPTDRRSCDNNVSIEIYWKVLLKRQQYAGSYSESGNPAPAVAHGEDDWIVMQHFAMA